LRISTFKCLGTIATDKNEIYEEISIKRGYENAYYSV
jgi:hypothetical protein